MLVKSLFSGLTAADHIYLCESSDAKQATLEVINLESGASKEFLCLKMTLS